MFFTALLRGGGITQSCDCQSDSNKNNYENSDTFYLRSTSCVPHTALIPLEFVGPFNPENDSEKRLHFSRGKKWSSQEVK